MTATIALRDYQAETLERVGQAERRGIRRQLVVAATGLGKTVMFTALARQRGGRTLILAHRDELIAQAVAKVVEVSPELGLTPSAATALGAAGRSDLVLRPPTYGPKVGIVKAGANDVRAQVVVASVQTLARQARLAKLIDAHTGTHLLQPAEPFGLVITDEAHHATASSYVGVYDGLGVGTDGGPLHVGFTATPDRGDGKGLSAVFDEVVASHDMLWGIRSGYLSDLRGKLIEVERFDEKDLKTSRGDYDQGHAGRLLEASGAHDLIVRGWKLHASDRAKTLVFTPTVAFADQVAASFEAEGIGAAMVSGSTPLEERQDTLQRFHRGEISVLANCAVLTEGYDEPGVDCVVIARPTKSRALYTQMVGRGTRRHPAKADCLILDVVGATAQHSLVTIPSLFGVDKKHRERNGDGTMSELVAEHEAEEVAAGRLRAEEVALFAAIRSEGVAWVPVPGEGELQRFIRPLPDNKPTVVLAQRTADTWTSGLLFADKTKQVLMANVSMELAQGVAEDYVRKHGGQIGDASAPWRQRKPSAKAKAYAKRLGVTVDPAWKAGDLSDAIDRAKARKGA